MPLDLEILKWIEGLRAPWLDEFMLLVTQLGDEIILMALVCTVYWCINKRAGLIMGWSFFLGAIVNQMLKLFFVTPRPWVRSAALQPVERALPAATGYSFPSGHTANAMAAYGGIGFWYRKKRAILWLCVAAVLLVAASRLYLGVHTPQDVLVSLAVGAVLLVVAFWIGDWMERCPSRDKLVFAAALLLAAFLTLYALFMQDPADMTPELKKDAFAAAGGAAGFAAGWFWERRKIHFSVEGRSIRRIVRLAVGLLITALCMVGLKAALRAAVGLYMGTWLSYFLVCLWICAGYPLLFTWAERKIAGRKAEKI